MKLSCAKNKIQYLIARRNGYLTLAVGSMLTNIILIVALITFFRAEKVILVPPNIERPMWVTAANVSTEYLSSMSLYLTSLLLNVTPSNADLQHSLFLRHVDEHQYQIIKTNLKLEQDKLKKDHMSIGFQLSGIKVDSDNLLAHVTGDLQYVIGENLLPLKHLTYILKFTYQSGFLKLHSFEELSK